MSALWTSAIPSTGLTKTTKTNSATGIDGTIVGFSGANVVSDLINLATYGIPRWSLSHVGIIANDRLYEAKFEEGVVANDLSVIDNYSGKVWAYELAEPLTVNESEKLAEFCNAQLGRSYDDLGALRSGGVIYSWIASLLHPADLSSFYCSELCVAALAHVGRFKTNHVSRYSPNKFVRRARWEDVLREPIRLK